jgi:hypothetical protein
VAGQTDVPYGETRDGRAVQPTAVEGVLLSHDEAYWYILSKSEPTKGQVVAIPVSRTSEIQLDETMDD